jgi:hypothetical protein
VLIAKTDDDDPAPASTIAEPFEEFYAMISRSGLIIVELTR